MAVYRGLLYSTCTLTNSMSSVRYQDKHGCTEDYYTLTNSMSSVLYQDKHGCTEDYYTLTTFVTQCRQYFIRTNMAVQRIIIL